ncbi:hypothetical protein [Pseudodesulfovibrio sediminis]|uniref:Shikimate kinase n=1 Tax=Pseudodesulfovibrio sediminis TaxID=2810563 RepID=A0ABN6EYR6_9BACT|nr:hypothetical protein [Pseudodesulfovibrio sediminis]BCS90306.1 hypothetical protein PSDVSF_35480 [Pseudodesulfovibrio sediminis]
MTKYLINEQYDVEDAEASKGFGKGEKREDYADAWQDTGNVVLIGLPGAGKAALAELLSERAGIEVRVPVDAETAKVALAEGGRVIVLTDDLVEDAEVQPLIHDSGKVFYLMADTRLLSDRVAKRDAIEDRDTLWREMSARLAVMEPVFYSVLHFIMQAAEAPEELLSDALEKVGY